MRQVAREVIYRFFRIEKTNFQSRIKSRSGILPLFKMIFTETCSSGLMLSFDNPSIFFLFVDMTIADAAPRNALFESHLGEPLDLPFVFRSFDPSVHPFHGQSILHTVRIHEIEPRRHFHRFAVGQCWWREIAGPASGS